MDSARKQKGNPKWLVKRGPKELELLLRAVLCQSSEPILITDDDRHCLDASVGAGKLLRLSRDQIPTRKIDDFVAASFHPRMKQLWRAFLEKGEQDGKLPLLVSQGIEREVGYVASSSILPVRHLFVLHDSAKHKESKEPGPVRVPSWVKDSALLLLDPAGCVSTWYAGAERIYGYKSEEAMGQHLSFLYASEDGQGAEVRPGLMRAASGGRFGSEVWHQRKDGSRFWANVLTLISYPRTDSRHLSEDVAATLPRIVKAIAGPYQAHLAPGTGERPLGRRGAAEITAPACDAAESWRIVRQTPGR